MSEEGQTGGMSSEFHNPMDLWDKGEYPIRGENGELYLPFFKWQYWYPLGPVLFNMSKYIYRTD